MWLAIKYKIGIIVLGEMMSGKTTLLSASTVFFPPGSRVITIEDAPEIRVPKTCLHTVISPDSIETYLKALAWSLRASADYIIVGEVREREAKVLFQAINTGYGGLTSFHAGSPEEAIKRLTGEPINIPRGTITSVGLFVQIIVRDERRSVYVFGVRDDASPFSISVDNLFESREFRERFSMYGLGVNEVRKEYDLMSSILRNMYDNIVAGRRIGFHDLNVELYRVYRTLTNS